MRCVWNMDVQPIILSSSQYIKTSHLCEYILKSKKIRNATALSFLGNDIIMFVCAFVCVNLHLMCACVSTCVPVNMHAYMYEKCAGVGVCAHMNINVLVYEHLCISVYLCEYVCMCECMCRLINGKLWLGIKLCVILYSHGCHFEGKSKFTLLTLGTLWSDTINKYFSTDYSVRSSSDHQVI